MAGSYAHFPRMRHRERCFWGSEVAADESQRRGENPVEISPSPKGAPRNRLAGLICRVPAVPKIEVGSRGGNLRSLLVLSLLWMASPALLAQSASQTSPSEPSIQSLLDRIQQMEKR